MNKDKMLVVFNYILSVLYSLIYLAFLLGVKLDSSFAGHSFWREFKESTPDISGNLAGRSYLMIGLLTLVLNLYLYKKTNPSKKVFIIFALIILVTLLATLFS